MQYPNNKDRAKIIRRNGSEITFSTFSMADPDISIKDKTIAITMFMGGIILFCLSFFLLPIMLVRNFLSDRGVEISEPMANALLRARKSDCLPRFVLPLDFSIALENCNKLYENYQRNSYKTSRD